MPYELDSDTWIWQIPTRIMLSKKWLNHCREKGDYILSVTHTTSNPNYIQL